MNGDRVLLLGSVLVSLLSLSQFPRLVCSLHSPPNLVPFTSPPLIPAATVPSPSTPLFSTRHGPGPDRREWTGPGDEWEWSGKE